MLCHPRVAQGFQAQLVVKQILPPAATIVSIARPGSNAPDLVALMNGRVIKFEIKSCATPTSPIVPYSRTVFVGEQSPLDHLVTILTRRPNDTLRSVVANHRSENQSYGFPCDAGASRSGKVPPLRITSSHPSAPDIRSYVINELHSNEISYLALVCKHPTQTVHLFYTRYGHNILRASPLPRIKNAYLSTYGTDTLDAMRVALKVSFHHTQGAVYRVPC